LRKDLSPSALLDPLFGAPRKGTSPRKQAPQEPRPMAHAAAGHLGTVHTPAPNPAQIPGSPPAMLPLTAASGNEVRPARGSAVQPIDDPTTKTIFGALDTDTHATTAVWIRGERNLAEAGYQDPVLGWVRVRAQTDSNGVRATVVPASSDASQVLSNHLSGLGTFLAEHHSPISSWTLAQPEAPAHEGTAMQPGEQTMSFGSDRHRESEQHGSSTENVVIPRNGMSSQHEETKKIEPPPAIGPEMGHTVSVIA